MTRRVVVTGIGMITALGHNACANWEALVAARSGIDRITLFDPAGYDSQVAGEVKDFDPSAHMDRKEARRADRVTQFAFVAAHEALKQSRFEPGSAQNNMAVIIGTAIGGITTLVSEYDTLREKGPSRVSPLLMPMMLSDMSSGQLSIKLGAKGV
ncbi:MAG: beta-ketoacyl synthase N-terminal-like domain-containing protein, partial [Tepidiformaceae bacterium]